MTIQLDRVNGPISGEIACDGRGARRFFGWLVVSLVAACAALAGGGPAATALAGGARLLAQPSPVAHVSLTGERPTAAVFASDDGPTAALWPQVGSASSSALQPAASQASPRAADHAATPAVAPTQLASTTAYGCEAQEVGAVFAGAGIMPMTCSFTATGPGGYSGVGRWHMRVQRDGLTFDYLGKGLPRCANPGFLQAGDQVELSVAWNQTGDIKAGSADRCI